MSEPLYTVYSADSSFVPLPVSATNRDNDGHNSGLRLEGAVPFLSVKLMKISCFLLDTGVCQPAQSYWWTLSVQQFGDGKSLWPP